MPFIAFLGCDGSGKSTVIASVTGSLSAAGTRVNTGHWRPKPFAAAGSGGPSAADDPHGQKARGLAGSVAKLGWLWLNWWLAWILKLGNQTRGGVLIFDRYHGDLLADPARYRYGGPMWLARLASGLMPQPDMVFFLDAPPEVLLSRKREVAEESLIASRSRYLKLCATSRRFQIIDVDRKVEDVVADVLNRLDLTR